MKYNGKELTEFKSNKNIAFNPKQHMIVWGDDEEWYYADIVGYFPDNAHPFLADNNLRYEHGAEIPKPQTNWDVYQERYGATMKSLDEALELFNAYTVVLCQLCPARGHCASDVRSKSCRETFKEWAETEVKDETARSV